jgi:lipoprotein-anchoring transpeptidase ErfK/SrfK
MMWRIGLGALLLLVSAGTSLAQSWDYPYGRSYYRRSAPPYYSNWGWNRPYFDDDEDDDDRRWGDEEASGGPRPYIAPIAAQSIRFPSSYAVGSIVIDTRGRQLFFIKSATEALRYPISVGRQGFSWTGTETISRKAEWPDWYPPEEMRERDPALPAKMTGGIRNPLGAKALYLGKTLYRIHGTNDAKSIGRAASSGCFRMLNGHIIDLASRVEVGAAVTVVHRLPGDLEKIVADQVRDNTQRAAAQPGRT